MVSPILRFPPGNLLVPHKGCAHKGDLKVRLSHQLGNAALPALQLLRQRHCSHGRSDSAALAAQLFQLSSSSSLAITAQLHQQRSNVQQYQPCSLAAVQPCSLAAVQPCSLAALQLCNLPAMQPCSRAANLAQLMQQDLLIVPYHRATIEKDLMVSQFVTCCI